MMPAVSKRKFTQKSRLHGVRGRGGSARSFESQVSHRIDSCPGCWRWVGVDCVCCLGPLGTTFQDNFGLNFLSPPAHGSGKGSFCGSCSRVARPGGRHQPGPLVFAFGYSSGLKRKVEGIGIWHWVENDLRNHLYHPNSSACLNHGVGWGFQERNCPFLGERKKKKKVKTAW